MLTSFFDQAPFFAAILSSEGRVLEVGRKAIQESGYAREEVLGRFFWDTGWWRGLPEVQAQLQQALAGARNDRRFDATFPYMIADGRTAWMEFSLNGVSEQGVFLYAIALGHDITDRVHAEAEIVAVRRRLDSALMAAEIATYEWDVEADRLYVDRNLQRLFGVTVDSSGSAPLGVFMAMIHPDDRPRIAARISRSVKDGTDFEEDYRVTLPEGGERWLNSRGRMIKDTEGRVVRFVGVLMDITQRKRAEQEREAIQDRLRRLTAIHETVLSSINDFAYVFDTEGRFLYANRPLLALYGRPLEEVVGRTFSQLGYPAWHAEMHLREIAQVISTRQPIQGEVPFRGESGISGVYDYIFTPVFGADGRVEAVAGTTRDVSDRKRGEARDRVLVAVDDATRPVTDPQAITQAAARILGEHLGVNRCAYADVEEDENTFNLTGDFNRDVPSIVGRYRFDQFGAECLRLMRTGEPYVVTDAETDPRTEGVREAYRATKIRSVICVPLRKAGRFVAAMAVHQSTVRTWLPSDIEAVQAVANRSWESIERARVVRVLAESEQRLSLAVASGRFGVWELELPARTLRSSTLCQTIYGRSEEQAFRFVDMLDSVHAEDRPRVQAALDRTLATGEVYDVEHRIVWPAGDVRWIQARGQATLGPDGSAQRLVGVTSDITNRKEAEREQIRLRDEALRASRAKDDFLATLSHELRTPLNPVLLLASESARDPGLDPEVRSAFETIRKNAELEARLIDDLLDLTAVVRGKLVIKKEVRDLHAILADAVSSVQSDFDAKHIVLDVHFGIRKPRVHADEVRLVQVFINLLKNAAKFTPLHGSVTLETSLDEDHRVVVRLADTGIGMTPEELSRVFDAFEQGDHAAPEATHRFGGLGLGLAIAQRLVQLHDGTIEATSDGRGRGAVFTVRLPLHLATGEDHLAHDLHNPSAKVPEKTAARRILLVEDHEATRRTLEQLLRRRGYEVTPAGTVAEALTLAGQASFDLILSDVGLPDGDGAELMTQLRARHGLRGVALTGYGMPEDIERYRAAGFSAHITKPIRIETLEATLREVFQPAS